MVIKIENGNCENANGEKCIFNDKICADCAVYSGNDKLSIKFRTK